MKNKKTSLNDLSQDMEVINLTSLNAIKGGLANAVELLNDIAVNGVDKYAGLSYHFGNGGGSDATSVSFNESMMATFNSAFEIGGGGGYTTGFAAYGGQGSYNNPIQLNEVTITGPNQPSAWSSSLNMALAIGEIVTGVVLATETGGASVYLIIDGVGRFGANAANAIHPGHGSSNLGGLIGKAINGEDGELYGAAINDGVTALFGGGAFGAFSEARAAFNAEKYGQSIYYGLESYSGANDAYGYAKDAYNNQE